MMALYGREPLNRGEKPRDVSIADYSEQALQQSRDDLNAARSAINSVRKQQTKKIQARYKRK